MTAWRVVSSNVPSGLCSQKPSCSNFFCEAMVLGPLRWPDSLMPRSTIVVVVVGATVVGTLCAFDH
jgi:hypothetical protein